MNRFISVCFLIVIFAELCTGSLIRNKRHWSDSSEDFAQPPHFPFKKYQSDRERPNFIWRHSEFYHKNHKLPTKNFNEDYNKNDRLNPLSINGVPHGENHFHMWFKKNHSDEENEESTHAGNGYNGAVCRTPTDEIGVCMPIKECVPFLKLMRSSNFTKKDFKNFKCNHTHTFKTHICCTSSDKGLEEQPDVKPDENETNFQNITEKVGEKSNAASIFASLKDVCGTQESASNKITGGSAADLEEFPWMALLQYSGSNEPVYACGGTLITDRFVLTAGHCVDVKILKQRSLQKLSRVVLGEYDTRNETDCFYMEYGTNCADPARFYNVEKTILHDSYESKAPSANDIGLVKLESKVSFTDFIRPICLPDKTISTLKGNEKAVISGWGRTETDMASPIKRKASLRMTSNNICNTYLQEELKDGQICLASENGQDSCSGDSGGAVMLERQNESGKIVFTVVGIISFGFRPCGKFPSVATNVSKYLNWIEQSVESNF